MTPRQRWPILVSLTAFLACHSGIAQQIRQATELDKAKGLNRQVVELYAAGKYAKAIPLAQQALAIREKSLGPDHPDVATSLNNLADLYRTQGQYAQAEPLHKRALAIREKALGPDHPDVVTSLNNLAELYRAQGRYTQAEPLHKRALAILEKALGSNHPDVARSLNNLAVLYNTQGKYAQAEPLYKRALAIWERTLGPDHLDVATSLNNLAALYQTQGQYAQAEPLYKRALAIWEKAPGSDHPDAAISLNNLAELYHTRGQYARAERLCRRALAIREKALGPYHPALATSLNNLAELYRAQRQYAQAEPLNKRALAIWEKALGSDHPDVAIGLDNLAGLYEMQGQYAQSEPLYKRAIAIREKALGPEHPHVATSLNNLAGLYCTQGQYAQSELLYKRALAISEKALGPDHPDVARSLNNLAWLMTATYRTSDAARIFERARRIAHQNGWSMLTFLSEAEQRGYLALWRPRLECACALSFLSNKEAPASDFVSSWWINGKGIISEVLAQRWLAVHGADDPAVRELVLKWFAVRSNLARAVLNAAARERAAEHHLEVAGLETRERELAESLARAGHARVLAVPEWLTLPVVARALSERSALLEIAQLRPLDFRTGEWGNSRYVCFLLRRSQEAQVVKVDLGEASVIDGVVASYRRAIEQSNEAIKQGWYAASVEEVAARARTLSKLLWEPLREHVKDVDHLIISPDGQLNLLPWEVLLVPEDKFLVEERRISYAGAGRDVVALAEPPSKLTSAVIFADPDFDLTPEAQAQAARQLLSAGQPGEPPTQPSGALAQRSGSRRSRDFGAMHFDSLPGFRAEAKAIEEPLTILTGRRPKVCVQAQALEGIFKQVRRPGVLTVHTHGWFLEDQDWSAAGAKRGLGWEFRNVGGIGPQRLFAGARIENPLLRCGLALSGANIGTRSSEQSDPGVDDGILTGLEIVGIDLTGTELVVLSACQTGVGEVKIGEGVYGLRRAFHLAGAKSLLVSLWRVPDAPTQALMTSFFEHWAAGMTRVDALRAAQRDVMAMTFELDLERGVARISGEKAKVTVSGRHPYFWAPFILVGDWR